MPGRSRVACPTHAPWARPIRKQKSVARIANGAGEFNAASPDAWGDRCDDRAWPAPWRPPTGLGRARHRQGGGPVVAEPGRL